LILVSTGVWAIVGWVAVWRTVSLFAVNVTRVGDQVAVSVLAAGVVTVGLHGTRWSFNGLWGDSALRAESATRSPTRGCLRTSPIGAMPPCYPPLLPWVEGRLGALLGQPGWAMVKPVTVGMALSVPSLAFGLWRRVLPQGVAAVAAAARLVHRCRRSRRGGAVLGSDGGAAPGRRTGGQSADALESQGWSWPAPQSTGGAAGVAELSPTAAALVWLVPRVPPCRLAEALAVALAAAYVYHLGGEALQRFGVAVLPEKVNELIAALLAVTGVLVVADRTAVAPEPERHPWDVWAGDASVAQVAQGWRYLTGRPLGSGTVFVTSRADRLAAEPVHAFVTFKSFCSHPNAEFAARDQLLTGSRDAPLLGARGGCCGQNRFDPVDGIAPSGTGRRLELRMATDQFPDAWRLTPVVFDTRRFDAPYFSVRRLSGVTVVALSQRPRRDQHQKTSRADEHLSWVQCTLCGTSGDPANRNG